MSNPELIPSLPLDIALDCLLRVPLPCHPTLQQVCHSWRSLVSSPSFYETRKSLGYTDYYGCLIQAILHPSLPPGKTPVYGVSIYDSKRRSWERLPHVPDFVTGLPLFCQCVTVGCKIVLLGGWDPISWAVLKCVYVYDFSDGQWSRGSSMLSSRSFFACAALNGKVVVAGGHDDNKNALRSAEMYNVEKDEWQVMPDMNEERDECKAAVMGGKFIVISGYPTESQGQFGRNAETYDEKEEKWEMVENMWPAGIPPSSVASVEGQLYAVFEGKLMRYKEKEGQWEAVAEMLKGMRAPACVTPLRGALLVSGPQPNEVFTCCVGTAPNTWNKVEASVGFSGFAQAACTLEL